MRRQDIQLLAAARQGDVAARCEVGRRYLLGEDGFPRHAVTGLEYLAQPNVVGTPVGYRLIAESLPLHDIIQFDQLAALRFAADAGSVDALMKLAVWICCTDRDSSEAERLFLACAHAGEPTASRAAAALAGKPAHDALRGVFAALGGRPGIDGTAVLTLAVANALRLADSVLLARCLDGLLAVQANASASLSDAVCDALAGAMALAPFRLDVPSHRIEELLENCVARGNTRAGLLLGRALCGIDAGPLPAAMVASGPNMRKGAALLLRAADGGESEAWMHLYRVHSNHRTSVANPQMARFFLEKSAVGGDVTAQRRLGALTMRSATTLRESELGIQWLHRAAEHGDRAAVVLLRSLVLPIRGEESEAAALIDVVHRVDPWLACRMRTARDFGLTKLEALCVDVVAGRRPWGLVVGPNPFIGKSRLAAARAIPALSDDILVRLNRAASLFEQAGWSEAASHGGRRKRADRLRHLLEQHGADESYFFADASSATLQTLRQGAKWAFRARQPLREALAA